MQRNHGIDPALATILDRAKSPEIDYGFAMDCLQKYADPRGKLKRLINNGALIRLRRGLYVISQKVFFKPYCYEMLANLMYGPSYVSLEWACQYHRLIPERVEIVTSVTFKRAKQYTTPLRHFTFDHLHPKAYPTGITQIHFSNEQCALVATKEKSLCDLLVLRRGRSSSLKHMKEVLFEDLRVEAEDLSSFDISRLERIHQAHPHSAIRHLIEIVRKCEKIK